MAERHRDPFSVPRSSESGVFPPCFLVRRAGNSEDGGTSQRSILRSAFF
nr:MAG TPA: hypothetical protein [Caudoviricetes sp.]